ncbi:MAG: cell division protein, partial [Bdellovibrionaceae bacterium]|nr:cell division protein [Pseudobdellovibrionaceae bacterium]
TDTFEPGSTLKTFVLANAIENKIVKPTSKIFCENGHFRIGKRVIHEAEADHAHATISVSEVLKYSSNIGTSKIALMMGDEKLKRGLNLFGFGEKLNVDLPGEAKGILTKLPWANHFLATVSFGQSITVTPLQLANAYATIANGGSLNKPYIVESVTDVETGEVSQTQVTSIRRVVSAETAAKMRSMLASVTADADGTGISARVPGFVVAGKTGTAQKINTGGRGYMKGGYVGSFTGFIPANDPQYVVFVGIDHPKKNGYYGAIVAAPLFSKIASYAVRKKGLTPDVMTNGALASDAHTVPKAATPAVELERIDISQASLAKAAAAPPVVAPYLKNLTMREVLNVASDQNIQVKFVGAGRVDTTYPDQGQPLDGDRNMTVILK